MYTTSEIESFDVVSNDWEGSPVAVLFRSYPTFEVVAKYEVQMSLPEDGEARTHTIHVKNQDERVAIQEITVMKAESKCNQSPCDINT